jgi:competence ComEA-like helix-hairpin-helix protein
MAKIPLRAYNQEIERLIENGRTDEAIAHCRYILQSYPRYIDVYRLLGKAFLETQRYGDAADIFQRVLSSIPDDFVAQVGMSIIREDEGNLDEAIWHMERAFEVQPANSAIQDELRRLYGRRDGIEPPKIRLTRGALARMYAKGDLYQQALAEIRAAFAENPNRIDLQVLMSDIYAKTGQRAEAIEAASAVFRKLPNCLVINRVMANLLQGTDRDEEAKTFQNRLYQLDPYFTQVSPKLPSVEYVPDQAITIEKLDWKVGPPSRDLSQPEWATSLGVELGELSPKEEEVLPDWLSGAAEQTTEISAPKPAVPAFTSDSEELPGFEQPEESAEPVSEEELPDWMKSAGWGVGEGETAELKPDLDLGESEITPPGEEEDVELVAAEIPDWLKAMAPPSTVEEATSPETAAEEGAEEDIEPWLDKILPLSTQDTGKEISEDEVREDWGETSAEVSAAITDELPDWLQAEEQGPGIEAETAGRSADQDLGTVAEPGEGLPDWLMEAEETGIEPAPAEPEAEIEPGGELPEWLSGEAEPGAEAAFEELAPSEPLAEVESTEELPDWLKETKPPSQAAAAETGAELPDWLLGEEETGAEAAPAEAALAEPSAEGEAPEELPDWLREEEPTGEPAEAEVGAELPDWLLGEEETSAEAAPAEAALAEPAAEIEAKEELPDWLSEAEPTSEAATAEISEELPDWLLSEEETSAEAAPAEAGLAEPAAEIEAKEELPDWLREAEPTSEAATAEPGEEVPDWLLSQQESGSEALPVEPAAEAEAAEELPEWLFEEETTSEAAAAEPGEEIPEWLLSKEGPAAETAPAEPTIEIESTEELPDWLYEEEPASQIPPAGPIAEAEPAEEIPDWLFEAGTPEEAVQVEAGVEPAEVTGEVEGPISAPLAGGPAAQLGEEEELPDWLFEEEEKPSYLGDTQPTKVEQAPAQPSEQEKVEGAPPAEAVVAESAAGEPSAEAPLDLDDTEAAFAWLESLAVKQGAEEALLLKPEERREEPPAWVQKAAQAETAEPVSEEEPGEEVEQVEPKAEPVEAAETEALLDEEAAFAWLESLAAKQGAQEALLLKPEERREEPPEWIKEAAMQEAGEAEISEAEAEEIIPAAEIPTGELPQEEVQPSAIPEAPPVEEELEEAEVEIPAGMDEEAAFAWLESLAEKQGAEEAVLLEPEERREEPPEWVSEETIEAAEEAVSPVIEEPEEEILPIEVEEIAVEEIFMEEAEEEAPEPTEGVYPEAEGLPGIEEMEEILALLEEEEAPVSEVAETEVEEAGPPARELRPAEEMPELPDWLAGPFPRDTGELEWKPPPILLDLNKASLIELERLMGVGFRLAQQIVNYRDANGPFRSVEDLQDVPGVDPVTLDGIRDHLFVATVPETPIIEEPGSIFVSTQDVPTELAEVRITMIEGNLEEALEKYAQLIDAELHIPRLVEDLQDITDLYPESLNAWQYLGDAYLRINQVREALKAYIKAEELLR